MEILVAIENGQNALSECQMRLEEKKFYNSKCNEVGKYKRN